VFAQAVNVERLLNMLRALDPSKGDNLADDEEIQVGVSMLSIPTAFSCIPLCVHHYFFWTSSTIGSIAVTDVFSRLLQELYRSCMALRPKIVKLIDKYSQKRGASSLPLVSPPIFM
jgi:signal transducing adaptor molecule